MKQTREELMSFAKENYGKDTAEELDRRCADYLSTLIGQKFKEARDNRYLYQVNYSGEGFDNTIYVIARDRVDALVLAERDFGTDAPNVSVAKLAFVTNNELPDGLVAA